jgi:site-specific DNA recombinase
MTWYLSLVAYVAILSPMTRSRRAPATLDPARAVAYLRVSTDEQHLGPEAQRAAVEGWAKRGGIEVVAWLTDSGVSGAADLSARPGLTMALEAIVSNGAGVLVVARRDRLARDVVIAATIERAAVARGARLVSADGVGNGDTAADQFMRTILDGAAAYERELIRARTRAALQAKKARGERVGTVPFGFAAGPDGRLSCHPHELAVAERAVVLRREGKPFARIAEVLACEGHVTRTGGRFDAAAVFRMCRRKSGTDLGG